jgi:hypothetical protein
MKPSLPKRNAKKKKTFPAAVIINISAPLMIGNTKRNVLLVEVTRLSDEIERAL